MIYPMNIQRQLELVEEIVNSWKIAAIDFDHVLKWVMQFDNDDFDIPIRIIKNLNVIGFEELNDSLTVAYSKLERKARDIGTEIKPENTIFAGIGASGKSGTMITYNFRIANNISEQNFIVDERTTRYLQEGQIQNIVLIDDIISTGGTIIEEVQSLTERSIPLKVENIFVLTAMGMKEGITNIQEATKDNIHVFSAFEYDVHDTVSSLDAKFYDGIPYQDRSKIREQLEYYGGQLYSRGALGEGNMGGLLVFYYNNFWC